MVTKPSKKAPKSKALVKKVEQTLAQVSPGERFLELQERQLALDERRLAIEEKKLGLAERGQRRSDAASALLALARQAIAKSGGMFDTEIGMILESQDEIDGAFQLEAEGKGNVQPCPGGYKFRYTGGADVDVARDVCSKCGKIRPLVDGICGSCADPDGQKPVPQIYQDVFGKAGKRPSRTPAERSIFGDDDGDDDGDDGGDD